jgi:hypothetical protein
MTFWIKSDWGRPRKRKGFLTKQGVKNMNEQQLQERMKEIRMVL